MALPIYTQLTSKVTSVAARSSVKSFEILTFPLTDAALTEFTFDVTSKAFYSDTNVSLTPIYAGTGTPYVYITARTDFGFTIKIRNIHPTAAFNAAVGILVVMNN